MCGIAGIYNFATQEAINPDILLQMSNLIAHRGPDDSGTYIDNHIGLAHRRLSIIDLSASGHQPLTNEDHTIWITYNGECYNYKEFYPLLRSRGYRFKSDSDTEVILHLYEEYGMDFLDKIDGMFALAIWDSRLQRLILARDRIGIKPLVYYQDHKRLLFASELKALLADPTVPRELNYSALGNYFRYMSIPDPESIFLGIEKLLPGHYLIVENNAVKQCRYWDLENIQPRLNLNRREAVGEFVDHFQKVTASHMVADVPVGAFLSGGVDSSAIVAFASQKHNDAQPINTFSITFKGMDGFDESAFASEVAERCGTNHREFNLTPDLVTALPKMVWHADEPFAISSALALYFLSELASQHTKVVMTGDGGDEVFAGYPWRHWTEPRFPSWFARSTVATFNNIGFDRLPWVGTFYQQARNILLRSLSLPADVYEKKLMCFSPLGLSSLMTVDAWQTIQNVTGNNVIHQYYESQENASSLTRKLYTDLKTTLVSEMLTKADRMTMAFGLEARVPFLDHHLVEWAFHLPDKHKLSGSNGKLIVKKALESYLPDRLIYRQKHGFNVPLQVWMQGQLQEMTRDVLSSGPVRKRGLLQPAAVESMLNSHFRGEKDNSDQIFALMVLELWFQQYVDRRTTEWQKF
jgi:asparagine synthase (glutamine-hydrolysing)